MPEAQWPGRRDTAGRKSRKPIDGETMIRQYRPLLGAAIALLATGVVAGELTLYEGENFQGRNLTLRSDMRDLDRTNFNDRDMSLVIRDGVWEVCSDSQFRGRSFAIERNVVRNLDRTSFNDRAASLRVERGYWIFCSDANFEGDCRTFGPGDYPNLPGELNRRISSGRMISERYP